MGTPYLGELRLVGFNFAPISWATCQGQLVAISQNDALYALVGTTYGGDGVTTFGLPNLQSRTAIHQGTGPGLPTYVIGQLAGTENVTLTSQQIPSHTHSFMASANTTGAVATLANNVLSSGVEIYVDKPPTAAMGAMMTVAGSSVPHNNLQPYLVLNWIIALQGIFPTQS